MSMILLITVRFHEGRYHGTGDWPPCPARLFQALVAGAGLRGPILAAQVEALEWLETLQPPLVAAPFAKKGQGVGNYVPNNDLDAVGGDPRRIASIRAKKEIRPQLFTTESPFLYAWTLPDDATQEQHVAALHQLAEKLYQLGRGVDLAWAWAELVDETTLNQRLEVFEGTIHMPSIAGTGSTLFCPVKGSFASLEIRYQANQSRFETVAKDRGVSQSFRRLPKPKFQSIAYDSPADRRLFELRSVDAPDDFHVWNLDRASVLVVQIRDAVVAKLQQVFPEKAALIEHWLIGRNAGGSNGGNVSERIRLIPLPSIGHAHADQNIRRLLVEAPAQCPIRADDLFWAFNGIELGNGGCDGRLTQAADSSFARHFGINRDTKATEWKTLTPVALPETAKRRRIEPSRRFQEAKGAAERAREQFQARLAVLTALRHAKINASVQDIIVQREPFQIHGARAEAFAPGTRFTKERLWHVAVAFVEPPPGPLVLGDGRFLGLGVFFPMRGCRREDPEFAKNPPEE
jgi:CRISPR-associated protein Csb2